MWRKFCGGTLGGDTKWRVAIASQLVTREDQLQRVRAVQNKGPIPLKGFCETPALGTEHLVLRTTNTSDS